MGECGLARWIGRVEEQSDRITPSRVAAFSATFDRGLAARAEGDPVPAGFHWTLFPSLTPESGLGADGHARRGGFLPPVTLPRRMWVGGRLLFHQPLRVGEPVHRRSTIAAVEEKLGRSGQLVFVTVRHVVSGAQGTAVEEEQDLVYREAAPRAAPVSVGSEGTERAGTACAGTERAGTWRRTVSPTATLLFRYSALTFNAHRIHYDRSYATDVEGYPGLVVHAPLVATLLLDLLERERPDAVVERFAFRARRPTFDTSPFEVRGTPGDRPGHVRLWSTDNGGCLAVDADVWTH